MADHIFLRDGHYTMRRRVPIRYSSIEPRRFIQRSLKTALLNIAQKRAQIIWSELTAVWEEKLAPPDASRHSAELESDRRLAEKLGYRYINAKKVAALPLPQLLERVKSIKTMRGKPDIAVARAVLGYRCSNDLYLSKVLDSLYDAYPDRVTGKNELQMRKHRAPRAAALSRLISITGDKPINNITAADLTELRKFYQNRLLAGQISSGTANKALSHIAAALAMVARAHSIKLGVDLKFIPLRGRRVSGQMRLPFSDQWIYSRLLQPGALRGLNTEARLIILGMINTGYRPSEGAGLDIEDICLTGPIPFIRIRPNKNRALKTDFSIREIPLVGISLEAFKQAPNGFLRYAKSADNLTSTVNKYLARNGLRESNAHSLYSLRHSLEDRMLRAGIDQRIRIAVLGHRLDRPAYGRAGDMDYIHEQLKLVSL